MLNKKEKKKKKKSLENESNIVLKWYYEQILNDKCH